MGVRSSASLWTSGSYRSWLVASTTSRYAAAVRSLAMTFLTYAITGSTTSAGVIGTLQMLLTYGLTLVGGLVTDSIDRRTLMRLHAMANGLLWGVFAVIVALGQVNYSLIICFTILGTVVAGLIGSADEAALRSLVTKTEYPRAMAVNQARDASADVLGPSLSGALYSFLPALPWIVSALGSAIVVGAASLLPALPARRAADDSPQSADNGPEKPNLRLRIGQMVSGLRSPRALVRDMTAGFGWITASRQVTSLVVLEMVGNMGTFLIFTAFQLGLLARGASTTQVALLTSAEAVAVLIGSAVAGRVVSRIPTGWLIVFTHGWIVVSYSLALISERYEMIVVACFLEALVIPVSNAAAVGYTFGLVPEEMQGRVLAADIFMAGVPVSLMGVCAGAIVAHWGMYLAIVVGLVLCVAAFLLTVLSPLIRRIPVPQQWPEKPLA